ncbi:MAG: cyclic-di-AMP receptor [Anaerolineaceae bacterium]|nr:cyclic-di-AMP receptor [Anaerolineaceae bacterium]
MKMIMAIVPKMEAEVVMDHLIQAGYTATFFESRGGVMRRLQLSLFIAVHRENVDQVIEIIRTHCRSQIRINPPHQPAHRSKSDTPVMADVGGSVIFMWDLDTVQIG